MRCSSISSAASTANAVCLRVRGLGCITCAAVSARKSAPFSTKRRKSPSVKTPTTFLLTSTTADAPKPFALISRINSLKSVSGETLGTSSPVRIKSETKVSRRRPNMPPGCDRAKSSGLNPRVSKRATANASPNAICAVVLAVGAKLSGQASLSTPQSNTKSAWFASVDCKPPVIAIKGTPWRLSTGRIAANSSLSPLLEMANTTSISRTMPKSPWLASPGWTNIAGVPVEASVAAILRPMCPLLPMPITTTWPVVLSSIWTALTKVGLSRCLICKSASASMSRVSCANCKMRASLGARTLVAADCFEVILAF